MTDANKKGITIAGWFFFIIDMIMLIPLFRLPSIIKTFKGIYDSLEGEISGMTLFLVKYPYFPYVILLIVGIFSAIAFTKKYNQYFFYIFLCIFAFYVFFTGVIVFALYEPILRIKPLV